MSIEARVHYWLQTWSRWRRRRHERMSWKAEARGLRRELVVLYQKDQALEILFAQKQMKINKLISVFEQWVTAGVITDQHIDDLDGGLTDSDVRAEKVISSYDQMIRSYSDDFDARMAAYERTGKYSRQESVLTADPPKRDDTPEG